ncbi:MAG: HypC/HybG/HupF family hydrogenase formation chaperone [Chthoniobacterales bacterium]
MAGISKQICLEYVPEAEIGDYVLVHVGFVLARIDEERKRNTFAIRIECSWCVSRIFPGMATAPVPLTRVAPRLATTNNSETHLTEDRPRVRPVLIKA